MATEPRNITPVGKTYTGAKGDSRSKIAKREYGDPSKWRQIYEANKDVIDKGRKGFVKPGKRVSAYVGTASQHALSFRAQRKIGRVYLVTTISNRRHDGRSLAEFTLSAAKGSG